MIDRARRNLAFAKTMKLKVNTILKETFLDDDLGPVSRKS